MRFVQLWFLGYSHLVLSLWATVITGIGLKRTLAVPVWLGILHSLLAMLVALPFATIYMRSPV